MNDDLRTPAAGWYPVEVGGPELRWWDGNNWTGHYHPARSGDSLAVKRAGAGQPVVDTAASSTDVDPGWLPPEAHSAQLAPAGHGSAVYAASSVRMSDDELAPTIILGVWGLFAFLGGLVSDGGYYGGFGFTSLFSGLHNGSFGLLNGFYGWWRSWPLGSSDVNLFILVPLSVLALSVAAIVRKEFRFVCLAGKIAVGSVLLTSLFWVPVLDQSANPFEFLVAVVLAALLPAIGLILTVRSENAHPAARLFDESPQPPQSDLIPPHTRRSMTAGTNGFAIAALVLGIIGGSVLAIVFGHVALSQIRRTGENGSGMALAGLVLGYIWLALTIAYFIFVAILISSLNGA